MSELKLTAVLNIFSMLVTFDVFQFDKSELNEGAKSKAVKK